MLAAKRVRPRVALFAGVSAVVFLLAGLGVGLSGYLSASATAGVQAGVAALTGSAGGFRISMPLDSDAEAQDARVRATTGAAMRTDSGRIPVRIHRDVETVDAIGLYAPGRVVRTALASIPGLASRSTLVEGSWPTDPDQASMQADAAEALAVRLGDRLTLPGGRVITVVALWRPRNPADPIWLGAPIPLHGSGDAGVAGFVVIDPTLWSETGAHPLARWTVLPRAEELTVSDLAPLAAAPDTVPAALERDPRNGTTVRQDGRLQPALAPIEANVQAAAAVSIAPLVLVAVLGIVTMMELSRMLVQVRAGETELLRARGASRRRLVVTTAGEAGVASVPAAVLGALAAAVALNLAAPGAVVPVFGWIVAGLAAPVMIAVLAFGAGLSLRDLDRSGERSGTRLASTIGAGAVILVVIAAIVATSQFLLYGSPLTTTAAGGVAVDPLAVSAPALALVAIALLVVALFPLAARLARRLSRRFADLRSLPLQQFARRNRAAITPVLLVTVVTGSLVLAIAYSGTWEQSAGATRAVQVGTDVRASAPNPLAPSVTSRIPGARATSPAGSAMIQIGSAVTTLAELPAVKLAAVVTPVDGAVDPRGLARTLTRQVDRPRLPIDARGLAVEVLSDPSTVSPTAINVTGVDAAGTMLSLRGTRDDTGFRFTLPDGMAPWTIRALDVQMPPAEEGTTVQFSLRSDDGTPVALDPSWAESGDVPSGYEATSVGGLRIRASVASAGAQLRLQPTPEGGKRLRVVISAALARATGIRAGSRVDMAVVASGGVIPVTVAAVAPVIPGSSDDEGVLADLGAAQDAVLRAGLHDTTTLDWWIATPNPADTAHRLAARTSGAAVIQTREPQPADQVLESARTTVWISAIAIALLALLAVISGFVVELRERRDEVAILRAVGVDRRAQARGRVIEFGALIGLGLIAGLVDGIVVAALMVPGLARTAIPNALTAVPTPLRFDGIGASIVAIAIIAAVAVGLLLAARVVRRQAATSTGGEVRR